MPRDKDFWYVHIYIFRELFLKGFFQHSLIEYE